jgi:hypothetical protein
MENDIKLSEELQTKLINHLNTMDSDAKKPWILKPPSIIAVIGLIFAGWQWNDNASKLQRTDGLLKASQQKLDIKTHELQHIEEKKQTTAKDLQNAQVQLKAAINTLDDLKQSSTKQEQTYIENSTANAELEYKIKVISDKLGKLKSFVLGEKLTDKAILYGIQPGMIVSDRECFSKYIYCWPKKVSMYLAIPYEFSDEIKNRIDYNSPPTPVPSSIVDSSNSALTLTDNRTLALTSVEDDMPWNKLSWTYDAKTAAVEYDIAIWIKNVDDPTVSTCYLIGFPKERIEIGTLCKK